MVAGIEQPTRAVFEFDVDFRRLGRRSRAGMVAAAEEARSILVQCLVLTQLWQLLPFCCDHFVPCRVGHDALCNTGDRWRLFVEMRPAFRHVLVDHLQSILARPRGASRQLAVVALRARPHEPNESLVVFERPVVVTRAGLALSLSTAMQCVIFEASLDLPRDAGNVRGGTQQ